MSETEQEKQEKKEAAKARTAEIEKLELEANKGKTGKGTRTNFGYTRGKGTTLISWEAFEDAPSETRPSSIQEFSDLVNAKNNNDLLNYLIEGFNAVSYEAASDPLADYVDSSWPKEAQANFRLVVRNYARTLKVPIEDAVNLIKPGFTAQFSKSAVSV